MRAFIVLNSGAVFAALAVAARLGLHGRARALVLGSLSGYLILVHSSVLLAGLLGHLTAASLATLVAAAVVAAACRQARALATPLRSRAGPRPSPPRRSSPRWPRSPPAPSGPGLTCSRPRASGSGTTTPTTWSIPRCGCASTRLPPRLRRRRSRCRPGIRCRPAWWPVGSWCRFRAGGGRRWRGSASPGCSTPASSQRARARCAGVWDAVAGHGRCPWCCSRLPTARPSWPEPSRTPTSPRPRACSARSCSRFRAATRRPRARSGSMAGTPAC